MLDDCIFPSGSCNTPLGIAKFVNNATFENAKYLVLEFGAKQRGDISFLCKYFPPYAAVITGICQQHMSTFKSLANVILTKQEVLHHIPENGFAVLNVYDKHVQNFCHVGSCKKVFSSHNLSVEVLQRSFQGTQIKVASQDNVATTILPQISSHVAQTFAMAFQACCQLGQDFYTTIGNVNKITQTPHRLQLISANGFYIIDDSYNASITGVQSCCKTLESFSCTKVVITQGIVEGGKNTKQLNYQCGKLLGGAVDVAIVVGKNGKHLTQGLIAAKCNKILHAKCVKQAVQVAKNHVNGGVLVFQNDLPN